MSSVAAQMIDPISATIVPTIMMFFRPWKSEIEPPIAQPTMEDTFPVRGAQKEYGFGPR
jgi:hypothetical protein